MGKVIEFLKPLLTLISSATVRRLVAFLVGVACVALSKKYGIEIDADQQSKIVALVLGYLGQSVLKDILKKSPVEVSPILPPAADIAAAMAAIKAGLEKK